MLTVAPIEEGHNQLPLPMQHSSASQYFTNSEWMLRMQLQAAPEAETMDQHLSLTTHHSRAILPRDFLSRRQGLPISQNTIF
ncbi:MAG: hypothetical protein ACPGLY_05080 [Rubripirellula sp.]